MLGNARQQTAPRGAVFFDPGSVTEALLLVSEGTVRAQQLSEGSRKIMQ